MSIVRSVALVNLLLSLQTAGENAVGTSGITFTIGPDGKATSVLVENLNAYGEGAFQRALAQK